MPSMVLQTVTVYQRIVVLIVVNQVREVSSVSGLVCRECMSFIGGFSTNVVVCVTL